jgi:hypothetical protein
MAEASAAAGAGADAAAADPMEPFNAATLANKFRSCRDHIHDIPIDEFVSGCEEVKKIIGACNFPCVCVCCYTTHACTQLPLALLLASPVTT